MSLLTRIRALTTNVPRYYRAFGLSGLLHFALLRYAPGKGLKAMRLRGAKNHIWLRGESTDVGVMKEIFLDREYELGLDIYPRVIVDAGSNIGLSSVYYALKYPDARVFSIEPEPDNYRVLERNAAPYGQIVPLRAALWNEPRVIRLYDPGRGAHGFVTEEQPSSDTGSEIGSVQAISIPDLMRQYQLDSIDILKIDIEGAEKEVFESASDWIGKVGVVVVEIHERFKPGCLRAFSDATQGMDTVFERGKVVAKSRPGLLRDDAAN